MIRNGWSPIVLVKTVNVLRQIYIYIFLHYTPISHYIKTTGEVNYIDYLVTVAPVKKWDILGSK